MASLLWFSLSYIKTLMFAVFALESTETKIRQYLRAFSFTLKRGRYFRGGGRHFRVSVSRL